MKLFACIDGLLVGTRYLAWILGVLGIIASAMLFVANLSLGIGTAAVFIAAFFCAVGVTLLLLPAGMSKGRFEGKEKYIAGCISLAIATVLMGILYFANGGLPEVNLLFV